jgi:hypothetical protein
MTGKKTVEVTLKFDIPTEGKCFEEFWKDNPSLDEIQFEIENAIETAFIADYGTVFAETIMVK